MNELLTAALWYATHGMYVFPVQPGEKTPHLTHPGRPWTVKWSEVATLDVQTVAAWWAWSPNANIGIAAKQSDLLIVDIDQGEGKDGLDQFDQLVRRLELSLETVWDTYTVRTPSGGYHLYYRWPASVKASQSSLTKNVDVRSNGGNRGGYVLAPPSRTAAGQYRVEYDREPAPIPAALFAICKEREEPKREAYVRQDGPRNWTGLAATVANAPEGNRNNSLLWAARTMCEEGATHEEAEDLLVEAAAACGLSAREARQTIRSAFRLQRSKS